MSTAAKPLEVKPPQLAGVKLGADTRIDRPLGIGLAPMKLPTGEPLPAAAQVGAFLYRSGPQGEQVWNAAAGAWVADPGDEALAGTLAPLPLTASGDAALPWKATLNPALQVDASGAPQFAIAEGDAGPRYFARVLVTLQREGESWRGLGKASPPLSFVRVVPFAPAAPTLAWKPAGPLASIEKPVEVGLAALTLADGSEATAEEAVVAGAFVYRADGAWWNEKEQAWTAAPPDIESLAAHKPLALSHKPGKTPAWQGTLAADGQVDKDDAPRFVTVDDGGAAYRLRVFAQVKRGGLVHLGLSAPSADLLFVKTRGKERFKVEFDTDGPQDCTRVTLRLVDAAGALAGYLRLRAAERDAELASCDAAGNVRAVVRLNTAGDIELLPAPDRRVVVAADFECERIRYRPSGGGPKLNLN